MKETNIEIASQMKDKNVTQIQEETLEPEGKMPNIKEVLRPRPFIYRKSE